MRSALSWGITQHTVAILYQFLTLADGSNKLSQNISKELPLYTA